MMTKKRDTKAKTSPAALGADGDINPARFSEAVRLMTIENTKSPEIARIKLQEMGILGSDGELSDNYK